jgi:ABC-type Zn2+ transport system substrate-binding protein/surface adhesin
VVWGSIIHKSVRTNDFQAVGIVAAIIDDSIIVTSAGSKDEYNIPKDKVQSFKGVDVILNANLDRLSQFEVKVTK